MVILNFQMLIPFPSFARRVPGRWRDLVIYKTRIEQEVSISGNPNGAFGH
jgi:hypothetical protein